jgi:hypothetical protein
LACAPPVIVVAPFGETDIERSQKAETRLLAAREIQPIAGIAQQDRASLRGLLGQRALVEFASADDMQSWRYRLPCPSDVWPWLRRLT